MDEVAASVSEGRGYGIVTKDQGIGTIVGDEEVNFFGSSSNPSPRIAPCVHRNR
jgi:hypothetical protein